MRPRPQMVSVPYGGGVAIDAFRVNDKISVTGTFRTKLYAGPWSQFLLQWGAQPVNAGGYVGLSGVSTGWNPGTGVAGNLPSVTIMHAIQRSDGTYKIRQYSGVRVESLSFTISEGSTLADITLNLLGSSVSGNQWSLGNYVDPTLQAAAWPATPPTFGTTSTPSTVCPPGPTNLPINPYVFVNVTPLTIGISRTTFQSIGLSINNKLAKRFWANRFLALSQFVGRSVTLSAQNYYTNMSPEDRVEYEGLVAQTVAWRAQQHEPQRHFTLNTNNIITSLEDALPLEDVYTQSMTATSQWDSAFSQADVNLPADFQWRLPEMRSYSESTQVGFRLRGIAPGDLPYQPPAVRRMFWGWVVEFGLRRKDWELARGLDKDGDPMRRLDAKSIKHRKSEVGPTDKNAPPLEPSWGRSRVRSLLNGRAHTDSAEFFWGFDAVTGRSFAYVLRAQRERYPKGRDVFGLSPAGVAAVRAKAWKRWRNWRSGQHPERPATLSPVARQLPRYEAPTKWMTGITRPTAQTPGAGVDERFTAQAFQSRTHTGFRRLNLRGEKWKGQPPLTGRGPAPPPPKPAPKPPKPKPLTFGLSPARIILDPDNRPAILKAIKKALGPNATPQTVATLAGAPKDTTANIFVSGFANENLTVYVSAPGIDIKREIVRARIGDNDMDHPQPECFSR